MESEHLRRKIVRSYYDRTTIVTIVVRSYDHNTIVSTIVLRSYFDRSTIVVRSKKSCDRKRSYYDRRQPVKKTKKNQKKKKKQKKKKTKKNKSLLFLLIYKVPRPRGAWVHFINFFFIIFSFSF